MCVLKGCGEADMDGRMMCEAYHLLKGLLILGIWFVHHAFLVEVLYVPSFGEYWVQRLGLFDLGNVGLFKTRQPLALPGQLLAFPVCLLQAPGLLYTFVLGLLTCFLREAKPSLLLLSLWWSFLLWIFQDFLSQRENVSYLPLLLPRRWRLSAKSSYLVLRVIYLKFFWNI